MLDANNNKHKKYCICFLNPGVSYYELASNALVLIKIEVIVKHSTQ